MSITILVKTKKRRIAKKLSIRKAISVVVACSLLFLVSSRSTESLYDQQLRMSVVTSGLDEQAQQLDKLHDDTQKQIDGLVERLAAMQANLHQLDAVAGQLAESNGLSIEDFVLPEPTKVTLLRDASLLERINDMEQALAFKKQQITALESILLGLNIQQESLLAGKPIDKGWLSSYYGMRKDPFSGEPAMHKGVDFAGSSGSKVIATGAGIVTWSGERYGYGFLVEVDHGNGLKTRYGHNKSLKVKVGDVVTKGQTIALMGNTGRSTGAHVHYEVLKNGKQVDPLPYLYR